MPWHLPADLKYFKKVTMGCPVIMGRNTYDSIGRPLPGRQNIVITRNELWARKDVTVAGSIDMAIEFAREQTQDEIFIIGGGNIFEQALPKADRVYLTRIHTEMNDGDVFFPKLPAHEWRLIQSEPYASDEKNAYNLSFEVYERIRL